MPTPDDITPARLAKLEQVLGKRQPALTVVFENVHDPHNISAVIRTCDAVGVLEVHGVYQGRTEFPELGSRSSASANKWVDVHLHNSIEACYSVLREQGFAIYTTHMSSDSVSVYDVDFTKPTALVFGNEHDGVSPEARALADGNVLVPQVGMIQSLNISVACAVSLYEAFRQRNAAGMYADPQLEQSRMLALLNQWCSK